jgi:hypothetical protein
METVLLQGNSKKDLQLLITIAKKLGIKSRFISFDESEALLKEIETGLKQAKRIRKGELPIRTVKEMRDAK